MNDKLLELWFKWISQERKEELKSVYKKTQEQYEKVENDVNAQNYFDTIYENTIMYSRSERIDYAIKAIIAKAKLDLTK